MYILNPSYICVYSKPRLMADGVHAQGCSWGSCSRVLSCSNTLELLMRMGLMLEAFAQLTFIIPTSTARTASLF